MPSEKSRDGVAVYRKYNCGVRLKVIIEDFPGCVLVEINDSIYIPPNNSDYYDFRNLQ